MQVLYVIRVSLQEILIDIQVMLDTLGEKENKTKQRVRLIKRY